MTLWDSSKAICSQTGLAIPECSCKTCLEAMLRQFHPGPFDGPIRITKVSPGRPPRTRPEPRL